MTEGKVCATCGIVYERGKREQQSHEQVREMRRRYNPAASVPKRGGRSSNADELANEFGISRMYVMQLVHGWYRKDA